MILLHIGHGFYLTLLAFVALVLFFPVLVVKFIGLAMKHDLAEVATLRSGFGNSIQQK